MKIWLDAHISPAIAGWISERYGVTALAIRDLGLRDASDEEIFMRAREADAVLLSKDNDFIRLNEKLGQPPKILWLTCGNTSNENLKRILDITLEDAIKILQAGDAIVEISEA